LTALTLRRSGSQVKDTRLHAKGNASLGPCQHLDRVIFT